MRPQSDRQFALAPLLQRATALVGRVRACWRDRRGNVAMIFALTLVPMAVAAGAGVDFARALAVRSEMGDALDAAGLALGAAQGKSPAQLQALAQSYFNANFTDTSYGAPTFTAVQGTDNVKLTASINMPTTLMNVVGIKTIPVSFSSTVVWGQTKLWVALVLDNTGSMSETDSTGTSKMDALKSAGHQLLTMLQGASANPGDVKVSIVPFNKDVNIGNSWGSAIDNQLWIDWTDWNSANGILNCGYGGGNGGYGGYGYGYHGWGGWGGWGGQGGDHNNNGQGCTYTYDHTKWNGCITDRTQDYDTLVTTPDPAIPATLFPAEQLSYCPTQLMGLSDDWTALGNKIDAMFPSGNTNQTIGFVWGWQTLTDGDPMNAGTLPSETQRVIILLSDGLNTRTAGPIRNRPSMRAKRRPATMPRPKASPSTPSLSISTAPRAIRRPLQYCASDSSKYFDLTTSGEIVTAFKTIGQQITNLRVAK